MGLSCTFNHLFYKMSSIVFEQSGHSCYYTIYLPPQFFHISDDWVLTTGKLVAGKCKPSDKVNRGHRVEPL
jgi:hypothetical protein